MNNSIARFSVNRQPDKVSDRDKLGKLGALLNKLPAIVECDRITGDDCFVARAHVASVQELEKLIDQIIPLGTTNTAIIQSSPVE